MDKLSKIEIKNVSLKFSGVKMDVEVLRNIDLNIHEHEIVTLIGPSGCGKSSLLNLLSNTLQYTRYETNGTIDINWSSSRQNRLGYIFQKDTLLPWRTLIENVEVGLEIIGQSRELRRKKAREWISQLGLEDFEMTYPHELSGGMRQRANIIRTLICQPELVLMDEPFGALDAQSRMNLQQLLTNLWEARQPTILFVTHDLEESILLGNRVVLFSQRPASIFRTYEVPFPHPRDIAEVKATSEFQQIYHDIWSDLRTNLSFDSNVGRNLA